ncbi:MAG TPA: homoserine kinase [Candidatus Avacidaminococcus intestinavium]|uniref:Homoserine kinase n=1 Tax=Candidatus Avacidaminococcus intestinavium TaxID=2840684 RepID=A0A9D1MRE7_9FIRM|nr:homoserine kinase [Candidatus Avacidaminococcus intestinavium]
MATSIQIRVPATSANCGAGFDTLGLACTMYNHFTYEIINKGFYLDIIGEGAEKLKANRYNLAILSFLKLWNIHSNKKIGLKVKMNNVIPLSRGLGSSSSAIVAGLTAANYLTGNKFSKYELLNLATEIEGHPDNVAPAIFGGITVSYMNNSKADTLRFLPAKPFTLLAVIPDLTLPTKIARQVLPSKVEYTDAIFNISRSSLFTAALLTGDFSHISAALEDRLHQPYRLHLIPGAKKAIIAAKKNGAYNAVISGAGSTLMAYIPADCATERIAQAMQEALLLEKTTSSIVVLELDTKGAQVLSTS